MVIDGIEYVDDDDLDRFVDGSVHDATLAVDAVIQGVPCAGGRGVVYYPSGRLKMAWLSRPADIGGVPCAGGVVTYLHENGRLWNGQLSRRRRIGTWVHLAGVRATFDDDGRLLESARHLTRDRTIGGLPCTSAYHVWLYADGRPSRIV